jgi:hypothetical protein
MYTLPNVQSQKIIDILLSNNIIEQDSEEKCNECEQLSYSLNMNCKLFIDDMYVTMLHVQEDGSIIGSDDDGDESEELTTDNYEFYTKKSKKSK